MQSFLEEVIHKITREYDSLEDFIFVLPSKRAGTFLKNNIAKISIKTAFAPEIYSIESFIERVSKLGYVSNTQQLFELYNAYLKNTTKDEDNFFTFSKWGLTLLQDFNEIDRYLIDAENLFSNLADIQEINHWSLQGEKTKMMSDYLAFWNNLNQLYNKFNSALLEKGLGHQGLVYRQACERLPEYIESCKNKIHVFVGFNALNTSESEIIQRILKQSKAKIYWDIDSYFLNDPIHDAGLFIRKHQKTWSHFQKHALQGVSENYASEKNIQITGVPKNVSQAKYVGALLKKLKKERPDSLKTTAVVLGDEALLNPILNAVPKEIEAVNITMGYPLNKTSLASLFNQFMDLYINRDRLGWFYQNVLSFLSHPQIKQVLYKETDSNLDLQTSIKTKNWTYITLSKLGSFMEENPNLKLLFFDSQISPKNFVQKCLAIILELKAQYQKDESNLTLEYLYRFHTLFNQILDLVQKHSFINDLKSLQSLFKELLSSETVDFQGDPLEGLQIMGMLESRNLDFETVILTSVNEGILPSGKSNNSFIPFDLKTRLGLPTFKEKDAVYTYHFYRLLQRAKNIHIIYNTEPDVLEGGEKSRLISQMLTDPNKEKDIVAKVATPSIEPVIQTLNSFKKDDGLMRLIQNHAENGFSPTSLSNYIRNPIDFYKRNLLGINDSLEVEETIAANTFGTIVHDTLEDLYAPFLGKYLSPEGLTKAKAKIQTLVQMHFTKNYLDGDISRGKNLIAFNVIVRYLTNYLDSEIKEAKNHQIKILGIEEKLNIELNISEIDFPITLKGKLDRIDEKDGMLRIIDYKTGKVESKNVEILSWDEITAEYDFSKAFQLLCYAFMYNDKNPIENIESGIISFKNLNGGLLKFATKDKRGSWAKKNHIISQETLSYFEKELKKLILEICNPEIPFTEKEV
ncbi:PD-(D/E)XK nuclease family protein [Maribacter algarum]|uniref:PD-(D/E)XK nuclease family protein n=1 Tax=Maribacter algarum (ex Zhang et al. 2020) TaxID=2578118 RepID=A0A5S3PY08_9FLAO|nr:PD-(D/E)XK nuclease family protein [Maribacter algarum]TMM59142.1 PD-(D/E)XK nuclease family protein [Maribacter algarum]